MNPPNRKYRRLRFVKPNSDTTEVAACLGFERFCQELGIILSDNKGTGFPYHYVIATVDFNLIKISAWEFFSYEGKYWDLLLDEDVYNPNPKGCG